MAGYSMIPTKSLVFDVSGVKVKIDFLFVSMLVLAAICGTIKEISSLILALLIHEGAHILAASSLGTRVEEIQLLPFGGRITLDLLEGTPQTEMLIVLAGPMANFAVAVFLLTAFSLKHIPEGVAEHINRQLQLGLFNLLPSLPLDGGRVFELWLRERTDYIFAARYSAKAGKILAMGLFFASVVSSVLGRVTLHTMVLAVLLYNYSAREQHDAPLVFIRQLLKKKARVADKGVLTAETLVVLNTTPARNFIYLFAPQKYYIVYVVDEDMNIVKCLTETQILDVILAKGLEICVKDII